MKQTKLQEHSTQLKLRIKERTGWNQARIFVIVGLVIAIIRKGRVNLKKLAHLINPNVSTDTNYRRLGKFFQKFRFDRKIVAQLMASFLPDEEKWKLTMDRTNWKFGKVYINILMLAVIYKGRAIPLIWYLLPSERKSGNSNYIDRIRIITKFINIFGVDKIDILVADREFVGYKWFAWLKRKKVPFGIRIMNNHIIKTAKGKRRIDSMFGFLQEGKYSLFGKKKEIYGYKLSIVALKLKDEFLIIATNHNQYLALENYKKRWEIETLFSSLKKRGFNLEETHMSDGYKIHSMVAILSICFVWCHMIGEWYSEIKPIKVLKHGRYAKSLFLHGLEFLADVFDNYEIKIEDLAFVFRELNQRLIKIGDY